MFADVDNDMRSAREEIFGPVISAIPFDSVDEVIRLANATEFGLGGGVWTSDVGKAHLVSKRIRAGVGVGQLLQYLRSGDAVRRLQDQRLWPGIRAAAAGGLPQSQIRVDQDGMMGKSRAPCDRRPRRVRESRAGG